MPAFAEELYVLSQRDREGQYLTPLFQSGTVSAAAANLFVRFNLDSARATIIDTISMTSTPANGVGQNVALNAIYLEPPVPSTLQLPVLIDDFQGAVVLSAGRRTTYASGAGLYVPGGWRVFCGAVFNTGVVANSVTASLTGIRVPIANIDRV